MDPALTGMGRVPWFDVVLVSRGAFDVVADMLDVASHSAGGIAGGECDDESGGGKKAAGKAKDSG